jgi:hypothetical protein
MEANDDWIWSASIFALNSKEIGFKARGAVTGNKLTRNRIRRPPLNT